MHCASKWNKNLGQEPEEHAENHLPMARQVPDVSNFSSSHCPMDTLEAMEANMQRRSHQQVCVQQGDCLMQSFTKRSVEFSSPPSSLQENRILGEASLQGQSTRSRRQFPATQTLQHTVLFMPDRDIEDLTLPPLLPGPWEHTNTEIQTESQRTAQHADTRGQGDALDFGLEAALAAPAQKRHHNFWHKRWSHPCDSMQDLVV